MDASDKKTRLIEEGRKISTLSEYMDLIKKIGFNEFESGDIFEEDFSNFLFKYHPDFIAIGVKEVYKVKDPSAKKYLDEIGMPSIDIGIDKIIILNNGDIWLNQDKYRSKEILDLSDVATYGMQSFKYKDKIKRSLVISTCKKLSRNLEAEYFGDFEWLLYSELETLIDSYENICKRTFFFDFFTFLENKIEPPQKIEKWCLRKEQETCKTNSIKELDKKDRVNYCMPPRTGKTLVGFEIQTHLYNKRNLLGLSNIGHMILVPTNDLKTQQADEYLRYQIVRDYPGELGGILIINNKVKQTSRLYFQTNNVSEIFNWIIQMEKSGKKFFIASTYQSIRKIEEVSKFYYDQTGRSLEIGSCFFDESHRLTGFISANTDSKYSNCVKIWTRLLKDSKKLVIKKRIFATATPRDLTSIKEEVSLYLRKHGVTEISGMENVRLFGERSYVLSIAEAVKESILPPMIIHGIDLERDELNSEFEHKVLIEINGESEEKHRINPRHKSVAFQIAKLISSGTIKKVIVYGNSISSGEDFKKMLKEYVKKGIFNRDISEKIYIESVSGLDGSRKRRDIINAVEFSEYSILINCRVFGEGVTIKSLDSVAFLDRRESKVDVIQNSLRASNNPDLPVHIILPLRLTHIKKSNSWTYPVADENFGMLAILLLNIYNDDLDTIDNVLVNLRETSTSKNSVKQPITIEDISDIPESDYLTWKNGLNIATVYSLSGNGNIHREIKNEEFLSLYNNGEMLSNKALSERLGVGEMTIAAFLRQNNLKGWSTVKREDMEKKILKLNAEGFHSGDISRMLGVSPSLISLYIKKNGLLSKYKSLEIESVPKVLELYHNGERLSNEDISKILGIQRKLVSRILHQNGLESWTIIKMIESKEERSKKIPQRKRVSDEEKEIIRNKRNEGLSIAKIALLLGRPMVTVKYEVKQQKKSNIETV